ncbi:hypothetical protein PAMA_012937 [Pampus argenteus]
MRPRPGWTSILHPTPLSADTGRHTSTLPEDRREHSFDTAATEGSDMGHLHGDFKGFPRRKNAKRGHVMHFGRFNSDTNDRTFMLAVCQSTSRCVFFVSMAAVESKPGVAALLYTALDV